MSQISGKGKRRLNSIFWIVSHILWVAVCFTVLFFFFLRYTDYECFTELDCLSYINTAINFNSLRFKEMYFYGINPLTHNFNYLIYSLFHSHKAFLYAQSIGMSAGLMFLIYSVRMTLNPALKSGWMAFILILTVPEIIYTGLYLNSSALAFPFYTLSILLLLISKKDFLKPFEVPVCGIAALLFVVSASFRVTFALALPVWWIFLISGRKMRKNLILGIAGAGVVTVFVLIASGAVDIRSFVDGIIQRSQIPHTYTPNRVTEIILLGSVQWWVTPLLLIYIGLKVFGSRVRPALVFSALCIVISFSYIALKAPGITTPKYLLEIFIAVPFLFADMLNTVAEKYGKKYAYWMFVLIGMLATMSLFISFKPPVKKNLHLFHRKMYEIKTEDGIRSSGSYLQMLRLRRSLKMPIGEKFNRYSYEIAEQFESSGSSLILILPENVTKGHFKKLNRVPIRIGIRLQMKGYAKHKLTQSPYTNLIYEKNGRYLALISDPSYMNSEDWMKDAASVYFTCDHSDGRNINANHDLRIKNLILEALER